MPSSVKRSIHSCHFLASSSSDCRYRNCSAACCSSWPLAFFRGAGFAISLATHVLRPGLHLPAHGRFRGAAVGRGLDRAVLLDVAAVMAPEADPVAAVAREALVALPEVLQVVGVDQRGGRVDQVVIGEGAPVDRLGRALEPEM